MGDHHHQHHDHDDDHHHHDKQKVNIPKGYVAVMVGHEGEEQKRFIIPVMYMNHPLFMDLLKKAENEYGFHHQGPINIPCNIQDFCNVQDLIHHDHHHHMCCFKD